MRPDASRRMYCFAGSGRPAARMASRNSSSPSDVAPPAASCAVTMTRPRRRALGARLTASSTSSIRTSRCWNVAPTMARLPIRARPCPGLHHGPPRRNPRRSAARVQVARQQDAGAVHPHAAGRVGGTPAARHHKIDRRPVEAAQAVRTQRGQAAERCRLPATDGQRGDPEPLFLGDRPVVRDEHATMSLLPPAGQDPPAARRPATGSS